MFGFKKRRRPFVSAVLLAAGKAARMRGIDRQLALFENRPVLAYSADVFQRCARVDEIVIVCEGEQMADMYGLVRDFGLSKVTSVVCGGAQRQDSAFAGIKACSGAAEYYIIHDGARPFLTENMLADCLDTAQRHGAAAVGVSCGGAAASVSEDGALEPLSGGHAVYELQTPQAFSAELYRHAMMLAIQEKRIYAGDHRIVQCAGGRVYLARGSKENIKITEPEDLALAEAILASREEGQNAWTA